LRGTYGHRLLGGSGAVKPKTSKDPPFEVTDEEAKRLVRLGVAECCGAEIGHCETAEPAVSVTKMKLSELKAKAATEFGVEAADLEKASSKAEVLALIDAKKAASGEGVGESPPTPMVGAPVR